MKRIIFTGLMLQLFLTFIGKASAQEIDRPAIWGIAKVTLLVSDFSVAREFYGNFLGFDEAFSYSSDLGEVISFKVSDRQFLEFVKDPQTKNKKRLVSVSFETENVEQMRQYLKLHGQKVPKKTIIDGAGNEIFTVDDPSGNTIEFIRFKSEGLHKKSKGKCLSNRRISKRIHHVGLYTEKINDSDPFYVGILKFVDVVRYPDDRSITPTLLYLGMGDCIECIEHYFPNDENFNHPCLLVDDMQETIDILKERRIGETLCKPVIGKGKRWILNLLNSDQTPVEFTEAHCIR